MDIKIEVPNLALKFNQAPLKAALHKAGNQVSKAAAQLILSSSGSGTVRKGLASSAPGQSPINRTGRLAGSLTTSDRGLTVSITDNDPAALSLEAGAVGGGGKKGTRNKRKRKKGQVTVIAATKRVLLPRPFLSAALEQSENTVRRTIQAAIMPGIGLK